LTAGAQQTPLEHKEWIGFYLKVKKAMRIKEAIERIESTPYLTVSGKSTLEEVAQLAAENRHIRGIYVVDEQGRLEGYLSLGVLIRSVIASSDKPYFHIRSLLTLTTSEKIEDVMEKHVLSATREDDVAKILDKMVYRNIKQVPVIDEDRRIVASLGILDLWGLLASA
jgi:CBS domain-containing protein